MGTDQPSICICPLMLWSSPSNMSKPLNGNGRPASKALMSSTTTCMKINNGARGVSCMQEPSVGVRWLTLSSR